MAEVVSIHWLTTPHLHSLRLLGSPEPPGSLLIHLGSRSHSINGHVEETSGTYYVEYTINVLKDSLHHFVLILGGSSG